MLLEMLPQRSSKSQAKKKAQEREWFHDEATAAAAQSLEAGRLTTPSVDSTADSVAPELEASADAKRKVGHPHPSSILTRLMGDLIHLYRCSRGLEICCFCDDGVLISSGLVFRGERRPPHILLPKYAQAGRTGYILLCLRPSKLASQQRYISIRVSAKFSGAHPLTHPLCRWRERVTAHVMFNGWELPGEATSWPELQPAGASSEDGSDWWRLIVAVPQDSFEVC